MSKYIKRCWGWLGLCLALTGSLPAGTDPKIVSSPILIHTDGSITSVPLDQGGSSPLIWAGSSNHEFVFGLPENTPKKRWMEKEILPIFHTSWEERGIRYTQTVLVTSLSGSDDDLETEGSQKKNEVLLVRLAGECLASEYTEAQVSFGLKIEGCWMPLALLDDLVFPATRTNSALLAMIDLPSGGSATHLENILRFKANMPPSESGGMTIKIPLRPIIEPGDIKRLRHLDFNEELFRLKKLWMDQIKKKGMAKSPISFTP